MSTFTWTTTAGGDWASAADWMPTTVPNANTATAVLPGVASSGYTVTIGAGESEIVNAITLGDLNGSHFGPTLSVAGTLTFAGTNPNMAFLSGKMQIDSGGVLAGEGSLGSQQGPGPFVLVNNGTVLGNAGANQLLGILTGFTNNGTVLADNGIIGIEGGPNSLTNLSGTTLTGGTWIVQGPPSGTFNEIDLGFNFNAMIGVDAANIILDGVATELDGYASGNFQPIEQQLRTIASNGTLQLLDDRGYATTNALTDAGSLTLQGGTLATGGVTVASSGTLEGFGLVSGGDASQGAIIANGGVLDIASAITGSGSLATTSGATLIVNGATASTLANQGAVYAASGLLKLTGAIGGNGSLFVQNGAMIEIAGATGQKVAFSGTDATLKLDDFPGYAGTLTGFAQGDTIVLTGATATTAFVSGGSLVVMDNGSTIDTISLAGSYTPSASFNVIETGGNAEVINVSGAPIRQDFAFTVILNDAAGLPTAEEDAIVNDLSAAAADWAQYLTGYAPLRIQLNVESGGGGSELANAGATEDIGTGTTLDGRQLDEPSSLIALTTGNYAAGLSSDITVNLPTGNLGSIYVNPSPTPMSSGTVPSGEYDLVTVFRHELAHGFGFGGLTTSDGSLGSQETLFDHYIGTINGTVAFTGPNAEAAYGVLLGTDVSTPVPLTTLNNGEGYAHFANSASDPNADDLMTGLGLPPATQRDISAMDLAVLEDIGAPVTAGIATTVACFAAGTLIGTERGDVAVEDLLVGDKVLVVGSTSSDPFDTKGVIWIGHRTVDCARHPSPRTVWPVRISAGAFGGHVPRRDLWLSPDHAVLFHGVLIPVKYLINGSSIVQIAVDSITYYHVELPRHDVLLAEGLPAESYLDIGDRSNFANSIGAVRLHPDFASRIWDAEACAPLVVTGPELDAAKAHIPAVRSQARRQHGEPGR